MSRRPSAGATSPSIPATRLHDVLSAGVAKPIEPSKVIMPPMPSKKKAPPVEDLASMMGDLKVAAGAEETQGLAKVAPMLDMEDTALRQSRDPSLLERQWWAAIWKLDAELQELMPNTPEYMLKWADIQYAIKRFKDEKQQSEWAYNGRFMPRRQTEKEYKRIAREGAREARERARQERRFNRTTKRGGPDGEGNNDLLPSWQQLPPSGDKKEQPRNEQGGGPRLPPWWDKEAVFNDGRAVENREGQPGANDGGIDYGNKD